MKNAFLFVLISLLFLELTLTYAQNDIARKINYQARLFNDNGSPYQDGILVCKFSIYEQKSGGVEVWSEQQDVEVKNGFINVYLGSVTPLDINFDKQLWLELCIVNQPPFTRTLLSTVPAAFNSIIAETVKDGAITSNKISDGSIINEDISDDAGINVNKLKEGSNGQVLMTEENRAVWKSVSLNNIWMLSGNSGTIEGRNFIGTTDNAAVEIRVSIKDTIKNSLILNNNGSIKKHSSEYVSGDVRGINAIDLQANRFKSDEVASGDYSVIGGGLLNKASGTCSIVCNGWKNTASENYSFVGGGENNSSDGRSSVVSGGFINKASGKYATVSGGGGNTASSKFSTVSGGNQNTASDICANVGGGTKNTASSLNATIGGGNQNTASGAESFIGSGWQNTASGDKSFIGGGAKNTASGFSSTVCGGSYAQAGLYGQNSYASGGFSNTVGSAQTSLFVVRNETTDANATYLYLNGARINMTIPARTSWAFRALVVGRNADGTANSAAFEIKGLIDRSGLITSSTTTISAPSGWDAVCEFDDSALKIKVMGADGTTIRWVGRVEVAEVRTE